MQKHSRFTSHLAGVLAFCGILSFAIPAARAQEAATVTGHEPVIRIEAEETHLELVERSAKVIEVKSKITRVDGFDESIVQVKALTPNRIHIWAVTQGVTTINITDEFDKTSSVEVFVKGDVRHLQAIIESNFPDSSVEALKIQDSSVVLRGWVTQPEHINYVVEIAEQFFPQVLNQLNVGGVQQVKLKVRVMEVQRSKIRQLGFNFMYMNRNGYMSSTPGQLTELGEATLPFKPGTPTAVFDATTLAESALSFGLIGDNNIFNGFFQALKEEGLLKILAEPNVVTTNGRPATLLSGGEFPILVPQSMGTVSIEWREFGTRLEAVPIILGNGRLRLELQPEVSERDFTNAVDVDGLTVPGLTTRRVNTQVEMKFSQTLIIGGLIANRRTAETDKIPMLGELPWIGAAFRRVRYDDVETELIVMVTPELVAPLDPDQVPAGGPGRSSVAPTDRELYIDGLLEVPNFSAEHEGTQTSPWALPSETMYPQNSGILQNPELGDEPLVPEAPSAVERPSEGNSGHNLTFPTAPAPADTQAKPAAEQDVSLRGRFRWPGLVKSKSSVRQAALNENNASNSVLPTTAKRMATSRSLSDSGASIQQPHMNKKRPGLIGPKQTTGPVRSQEKPSERPSLILPSGF